MVLFYSWIIYLNEKYRKQCLISINAFNNYVSNILTPRLDNKHVSKIIFTTSVEKYELWQGNDSVYAS